MNTLPVVLEQRLALDVDVRGQCASGRAQLRVRQPTAGGVLGLHAFGLDVSRVTVDGLEAEFALRPYHQDALPTSLQPGMLRRLAYMTLVA